MWKQRLLTLTKLRSENRGSLGNFQATYKPIFYQLQSVFLIDR